MNISQSDNMVCFWIKVYQALDISEWNEILVCQNFHSSPVTG